MNNTEVKKITIIGGGTSAWLSAAYLTSKGFFVTVIDKEIGNPVGVGEATILGFGEFMADCGFEFNDWFINCDATFKAGILYPNWIEKDNEIWHPFYLSPNTENNIRLHDAWTHNQELDFKTRGLSLYDVSKKNKIDLTIINSYAFHIDAGKLVKYIQERLAKQCSYIQSEVTDVIRDNLGNVQSLKLRNNKTVYADLFVDCTGFNSVINNSKFESLEGRLFCNTALACPVQYIDKQTEMHPYTKAVAVDHGWVWITPTASRIGSGLVFDKNITSVDLAKDFFVSFWNERVDRDKIRVLDWTPRYTKTPWNNNVVSIGLSAGFIEPLESTGIALIQSQVRNLVDRISDFCYTNASINLYNSQFEESFENTVDFVSLHYSKTKRTEPFWQNVIANYEKSQGIKIKEKMLQSGPLYTEQRKSSHIFSGANWTAWLVQMGYKIGNSSIVSKEVAIDALDRYNNAVEKYRHTWSVDHIQEVDRIKEYADNYLKR